MALLSLSGASAPVELTVDGTSPSLREVFSGGEPWLVWCSDSSDGHDVSAMHSIVDQAAPLLMGVARVGILDCEEELPSGKTTYEKLHLDESSPTLFLAANGAAPKPLKAKNVKSANSIVKFVTKHAQPVLRRPTSADDLKDHCLGRKWCAVVLTDGRLRDEFKSDTNALMRNNRGVSFNAVDASKYRLSTEPKVLRKGEPSEDEPSMVVFNRWKNENGKAVTLARVHRGDLASGAEAMLEEAQVLKGSGRPGGSGWVTLSAPPRIFYRKGASKLEMGSDGADSSAADDSGGAEEMSTWDEADEVAAEVSAKKKAEREQRKAEREEQRESEDDDREARRAARKAARAEKAERETEEARAAVRTNLFRHCIGESELRSVCIVLLQPVLVVRRQRRRKRPVSGRSESARRNGERRWRRRSRLR